MKNLRNFAIATLCVIGLSMPMTAQTTLPQKGYYLGIATGASMGTCTFRSYSDNGKTVRAEYGISAGYRFSPLFSLDLNFMRGNVEMTPMDCCTEQWLSVTGQMFASKPTASELASCWKYSNLTTETKFARFSLQGNINLLYIFESLRDSRWKFDVSPMIGGIQTHTTISGKMESGDFNEQKYASQWHFTYGGQGSFGVALDNNIEVRIYGGVNFLTGDRFDNLPKWQHTENLMYEGGAKLIWNFGNASNNKIAAIAEQENQMANGAVNVDLNGVEERLDMIYNELTQLRAEGIAGNSQGQQVQGSESGEGSDYTVVLGGYPFSIFFNLNSAELKSDNDRVNLKTFAQFAKKYDCKIRLRGTCDEATGSAGYNQALSERRCNTVKDELVRFGMDAQDIVIEAAGGVSEFDNVENNRRVFLDFVR